MNLTKLTKEYIDIATTFNITDYAALTVIIFKDEIKKNEFYIKSTTNALKENQDRYKENIQKLSEEIDFILCGSKDSLSFDIDRKKELTTFHDRYLIGSVEYFGSTNIDNIDDEALKVSNRFNISLVDSLLVILLGYDIMRLNARITMADKLKEIFMKKNPEKALQMPSKKELLKIKDDNISKIISLTKKEKSITDNEFCLLYLDELEKDRGNSKEFDKFLDFLQKSKDYGIIPTFCEMEEEGPKYIDQFSDESIDWKDF